MISDIESKKPLPPNPYRVTDQVDLHGAYNECLNHEREAMNSEGGDKEVINARCLGYLLLEAPCEEGRDSVAAQIIGCEGYQGRSNLAVGYIEHMFRFFRGSKGETPAAYDSCPVDSASQSHQSAKYAALKRDGYRCMVTHCPDSMVWDLPALRASLGIGDEGTMVTNFWHIFPDPPSTNDTMENPNKKSYAYAELAWKYVKVFGGFNALQELQGAGTHRLSNGLTLSLNVRAEFDELNVWFEEAQEGHPANTYFIKSTMPFAYVPSSTTPVTFVSHDPRLELPDPKYLKLHAAVCRVAHLSGAAEYMNQHDRDIENLSFLASDGSSANLFAAHLERTVEAY
ncbi:hypothetical protein D9611_008612 [Ephemerocybe angulata]|uniref:HNH nuclease domain-containing protein n=1 Tax=Ephemerocybe angulata TaxID=980116 RepID=A0A8H5EV62_9AGAR|nr:hypothetical protein D9611_008612 [Tulosesus angulatus]